MLLTWNQYVCFTFENQRVQGTSFSLRVKLPRLLLVQLQVTPGFLGDRGGLVIWRVLSRQAFLSNQSRFSPRVFSTCSDSSQAPSICPWELDCLCPTNSFSPEEDIYVHISCFLQGLDERQYSNKENQGMRKIESLGTFMACDGVTETILGSHREVRYVVGVGLLIQKIFKGFRKVQLTLLSNDKEN